MDTDTVTLRLEDYLSVLPSTPENFGDQGLAGLAEISNVVEFTGRSVLSEHSAATGVRSRVDRPDDRRESHRRGRRRPAGRLSQADNGVARRSGRAAHTRGVYLALTPGDPVELAAAAYLFGTVAVRLRVPDFAIQQFETGQPWSVDERQARPTILGGHDVAVSGRGDGMFDLVTWGQHHRMDEQFYRRYCDEAVVYLSLEFLQAGEFPAGFNLTQLHLDLMRREIPVGSDAGDRPVRRRSAGIARAERAEEHRRRVGHPLAARPHRKYPHRARPNHLTAVPDAAVPGIVSGIDLAGPDRFGHCHT